MEDKELRDLFAAFALAGINSNNADWNPNPEIVAEGAFKQADAMLKARKQE